jgi:hypothetical protein
MSADSPSGIAGKVASPPFSSKTTDGLHPSGATIFGAGVTRFSNMSNASLYDF